MSAPAPSRTGWRPALSPSRASDFKQCPLLYRFRAIDRLPEPVSPAQLRGSVVHAALEELYALPAPERVHDTALTLVDPALDRVLAEGAEVDPQLRAELLRDARALLSGYYRLEDPTRFEPDSCEQRVEVELADGTLLRGFVDRIDIAPTGEMRVVDYKTGKSPSELWALAEAKALFQMKFYAVALWRSRGVLPAKLRLLYLADGQVLDYSPDVDELVRFERTLTAIWRAIQSAGSTGDFRSKRSKLCSWCAHQQLCPEFGGTPPVYPGWPEEPGPGGRRRAGGRRVSDCHYRRLPEADGYQLFESTPGTASNWDAAIQHGSPPLALLTRAIEDLYRDRAELRVGRLVLDILGAIPVAPVKVRAWVERPGARITMAVAEMSTVEGRDRVLARVSAWLLATSDTADACTDRHPPLVEGAAMANPHGWMGAPGYLDTVSWRKQRTEPGEAAVVWMSPLVPLIDSEPLTDLQRLAMVVDSANGVGAALDPDVFVFMNTDTAVHLHRAPRGNDFALRARGSIGPDGIGVTTADIFDRQGFIGTSAQTLLVQRR